MRLEHYPQEKLKEEILTILQKHLDLEQYRVFFFGSRVEGKGTDRSDIDVGIEGPRAVPFETLENIKAEVERLSTLYKIDIVDFHELPPKFQEVARQHIEILNP